MSANTVTGTIWPRKVDIKIIILSITRSRVVSDITKAGGTALFIKMDVTKAADWKTAVDGAVSRFGKIDILVNNAGWTYRRKESLDVTESEYDRKQTIKNTNTRRDTNPEGLFDINVKGIYHSINATVPLFLAQKSGNIINVSSCVTSKPVSGLLYYNATKGAVDLITRGLATEYSSRGIRVNGVSPSMGNTGLAADFVGQEFTPDVAKLKATEALLNRLCTPTDIAKACLYFATPYFNDFQTYAFPLIESL